MKFEKYMHIEKFKNTEVEGIEFGKCYIFPKLDGCFDYKTKILLSNGTYEAIGKIVNQKMDVEVMSFDVQTQAIVPRRIINYFKYSTNKDEWLTITVQRTAGGLYRGGGRNTQLKCTKNHKFIIDAATGSECDANDLKVGQYVYVPQAIPAEIQRQVILGTLLGDGSAYPNRKSIYVNGISFSHSIKQKEYIDFKIGLLGSLYKSSRSLISGFGSDMISVNSVCNKITQNLYEIAYKDCKKTVTKSWLTELNSLGLAIWYMDDGTLSGNRAKLSIEGFSRDEQYEIVDFFINRGNYCYLQDDGKGYKILVFSPESTEKLMFDISPYVIPTMQYKLKEEFRGLSVGIMRSGNNKIGLIKRKIVNIKNGKKDCYYKQGMCKYDIEVDGSHTYFAENVLVHNSNASVWYDDKVCAGSRNRQLSVGKGTDNAGFCDYVLNFWNGVCDFVEHYKYLRLFGEWLIPLTFKDYHDNAWRKFYVFDVYSELDGRYLEYEEYKQALDRFDIDYIPPLCIIENPTDTNLYNELKNNYYLVKDGCVCGEGIVIKNYNFKNKFGRITWAKLISNEFKTSHSRKETTIKKTKNSVEQEICDKYVTDHLVEKVYAKIVNEMEGWNSHYIPRLMATVYYDLITEETWMILKKFKNPVIDFKQLNALVIQKIKEIKSDLF